MKPLKIFYILLIATLTAMCSYAQTDTIGGSHLQISLLTCSPGEELYSTFGHSALRVVDSTNGSDMVFNYGTFDFDDPDFYKKFTEGKLLYFVSLEHFHDFIYSYQIEHRGVQEQILNLSAQEKEKLYNALQHNAMPENKYYKYDFIYDNCSTRLRDIVSNNAKDSVIFKNILPSSDITFRKLLYVYLDKGQHYWNKLGIDILLGSPIDKKVMNNQAMFLPDYLLKGFDSATITGKPLVTQKQTLLEDGQRIQETVIFTPLVIFCLLFLIVGLCTVIRKKGVVVFLKIFDMLLFIITGALGVLLLFMWLGTDHNACRGNLNLLWAVPFNLPMAFFMYSQKKWVKTYFKMISWLSLLLLVSWLLLPQQLNTALIPIAGLLFLRGLRISQNRK